MMSSKFQCVLFFFCTLSLIGQEALATAKSLKGNDAPPTLATPWTKSRQLSNFQTLLQHSPFSLSSIEESSPLSERYAITGIINLNGEDEVFIFDRNDQSHELVTKTPNEKAMVLIAVIPQEDPTKLKATVSIGGEVGTLSELEQVVNKPGMGSPSHFPNPASKNPYSTGFHPSPTKNTSYPPSPNYPGNSYSHTPHYPSPSPSHPTDHRFPPRPPIPNPSAGHSVPMTNDDDLD